MADQQKTTNSLIDDKIQNFTMDEAVKKYNEYFKTNLDVLTKQQAETLASKTFPATVTNTTTLPGTGLQIWLKSTDNTIYVVHINYKKDIAA